MSNPKPGREHPGSNMEEIILGIIKISLPPSIVASMFGLGLSVVGRPSRKGSSGQATQARPGQTRPGRVQRACTTSPSEESHCRTDHFSPDSFGSPRIERPQMSCHNQPPMGSVRLHQDWGCLATVAFDRWDPNLVGRLGYCFAAGHERKAAGDPAAKS